MNRELERWLEAATKGLPKETAAMVREELEAHYWDAVAEYQADGSTPTKAHEAALADLGEVRDTARGLKAVHLAWRRYSVAVLLSLVYPVILSLTFKFPEVFVGDASQEALRSFVAYHPFSDDRAIPV